MIIICAAILAWILSAKCGMQWGGAGAAWLIAAMMDAGLMALLIVRLTEK
jgi:hypothetical protein